MVGGEDDEKRSRATMSEIDETRVWKWNYLQRVDVDGKDDERRDHSGDERVQQREKHKMEIFLREKLLMASSVSGEVEEKRRRNIEWKNKEKISFRKQK